MKTPSRSPIGFCPICRVHLFGPNIIDHYISRHPQVLRVERSRFDDEINRRLREEYKYNGVKPENS